MERGDYPAPKGPPVSPARPARKAPPGRRVRSDSLDQRDRRARLDQQALRVRPDRLRSGLLVSYRKVIWQWESLPGVRNLSIELTSRTASPRNEIAFAT